MENGLQVSLFFLKSAVSPAKGGPGGARMRPTRSALDGACRDGDEQLTRQLLQEHIALFVNQAAPDGTTQFSVEVDAFDLVHAGGDEGLDRGLRAL